MSAALLRAGGTLWRGLFWLCFASLTVVALLPKEHAVSLRDVGDKVEHMLAFATLAALSAVAFPHASRLGVLARLSLFGAGIEVLQTIPRLHRDGDPIDWIADTVAAGLVLALCALLAQGGRALAVFKPGALGYPAGHEPSRPPDPR
jgi:hypothetical protein